MTSAASFQPSPLERRDLAMRCFGAYVRTLRTLANKRQTDVAEEVRQLDGKIKMHARDIYAYESGQRLPQTRTANVLFEAIGGHGDDMQRILLRVAEYAVGATAEERERAAEAYGRTLALSAAKVVDRASADPASPGGEAMHQIMSAAAAMTPEARSEAADMLHQLANDPARLRELVRYGLFLADRERREG